MTQPSVIAADRLKSFVERIEKLNEEKKAIGADIRAVYNEAKGVGFDAKAMRKVIVRRQLDEAEREEQDAILELYEAAVQGNVQDRADAAEHLDAAVGLFNSGLTVRQVADRLSISASAAGRLRQLAEAAGRLAVPLNHGNSGTDFDPETGEVFEQPAIASEPMVSATAAEMAVRIAYLAGQNPVAGQAVIGAVNALAEKRSDEPQLSAAPVEPQAGPAEGTVAVASEPETERGGIAPSESPGDERVAGRVPPVAGDDIAREHRAPDPGAAQPEPADRPLDDGANAVMHGGDGLRPTLDSAPAGATGEPVGGDPDHAPESPGGVNVPDMAAPTPPVVRPKKEVPWFVTDDDPAIPPFLRREKRSGEEVTA